MNINLVFGNLHVERDALHSVPDGVMGILDHGLVIAVQEDLVTGGEVKKWLAQVPCANLVPARQVFHSRDVEPLPLLNLAGSNKPCAAQVSQVGIDRIA